MKQTISTLTCIAFLSLLCLEAPVMAASDPMYIMYKGKMMMLTPLTKDVKLKNGCTVCTSCTVIDPKGKKTKVKEGEVVTPEGDIQAWLDNPKR